MSRPTIPAKVQNRLWAQAAGRCEFRGCNKCLWKDETSQETRNGAHIAHIISWTPYGPRGDEERSARLATDISNLMLTCPEHNNLIDSKDYEDEYSIECLQKMKKEHEDRVYYLTGLGEDYSLRVIELVSKIHGQTPSIKREGIIEAIRPFYPADGIIRIDLSNVENIENAKRIIDQKIAMHFSDGGDQENYAAFIMAKIPYSCYLGYAIGNKASVKTYQFFRDTENWKWRSEQIGQSIRPVIPDTRGEREINLLINISGVIDKGLIQARPVYALEANNPGFMFLQSNDQVIEFRLKYREILNVIRSKHGEDAIIHLYVVAPNPITFEIGKGIMKNLDPTVILYDKAKDSIAYQEVMHLHDRIRSE